MKALEELCELSSPKGYFESEKYDFQRNESCDGDITSTARNGGRGGAEVCRGVVTRLN